VQVVVVVEAVLVIVVVIKLTEKDDKNMKVTAKQ
jgi:hypothetical protein